MDWQIILALVITIPIIMLPVTLIWYLNIGGLFAAIKQRQATREQSGKETAEPVRHITVEVKE